MSVSIGDKFGNLSVVSFFDAYRPSGKKKLMATCECECGALVNVEKYNLSNGNTTKCRNCAILSRANKKSTHGHSMSRKESDPIGYNCYTRWQAIKRRCYKEYDSHYKHYGARGIKMCDRWLESYESFLCDMGLPPTKDHQIDRIDNNGDYEPSNCRWVERKVNARNKRNNRMITANGETMTLVEWSEKTGLKRECIAARLKRGWSTEKALGITN